MDNLHYSDSGKEVKLGDRFEIKPFLFSKSDFATVTLIPESIGKQSEDARMWNWRLDSGDIRSQIYLPSECQPSKRFSLIARSTGSVETINEDELEEIAQKQMRSNPTTFKDMAWVVLIGVALMVVVMAFL